MVTKTTGTVTVIHFLLKMELQQTITIRNDNEEGCYIEFPVTNFKTFLPANSEMSWLTTDRIDTIIKITNSNKELTKIFSKYSNYLSLKNNDAFFFTMNTV